MNLFFFGRIINFYFADHSFTFFAQMAKIEMSGYGISNSPVNMEPHGYCMICGSVTPSRSSVSLFLSANVRDCYLCEVCKTIDIKCQNGHSDLFLRHRDIDRAIPSEVCTRWTCEDCGCRVEIVFYPRWTGHVGGTKQYTMLRKFKGRKVVK